VVSIINTRGEVVNQKSGAHAIPDATGAP